MSATMVEVLTHSTPSLNDIEAVFQNENLAYSLLPPWIHCVQSSISRLQGWKLHLSSIPSEAISLLCHIIPILRKHKISFKVAADIKTLLALNAGALGVMQIGKFITIYPEDDAQALRVAKDLVKATATFHGPKIITDLRLSEILYARYGGFVPMIKRNRFGHLTKWIQSGLVPVADDYSVPLEVPEGVKNPFSELEGYSQYQYNAEELKTQRLLGGYLILDLVRSHVKGSIFLAIDSKQPADHGIVILKEGRGWCDTDLQGRDIRDRLTHQYRILHALGNKDYTPRVYDLFECSNNRYLVLEFIKGRKLSELYSKPFGAHLLKTQKQIIEVCLSLVDAVADLHSKGIVHRDLTVNNILVREDQSVCLIDFELAFEMSAVGAPFAKGTPGFMSPEQEKDMPPTVKDDIYALGACLLHVFTCLDPRRLINIQSFDRTDSVRYLAEIDCINLTKVLVSCLETDPSDRPSLGELAAALRSFGSKPTRRGTSSAETKQLIDEDYLAEVYRGLLTGTTRDAQSLLFVSARPRSNSDNESYDFLHLRSAHNGMGGILYAISRFHGNGISIEGDQATGNALVDWLLEHHPTQDDQLPGLHFGEAGVSVAIAEAICSGLIQRGSWENEYFAEALNGPIDWPDLTHGAAGQGLASLICTSLLKRDDLLRGAHNCADYLLETQEENGSWKFGEGVDSLKGATYTGFAHGVAGMLYFLIEYHQRFKEPQIWESILKGVDWLLQLRVLMNGCTVWPIKPSEDEFWHWWCHGEAGISLTFLKLFQVSAQREYKDVATSALSFHQRAMRFANLSHCHGLSGLGEIYLEAYKTLGDESWKQKASEVVTLIQKLARRDVDKGTTWLVENPHMPMADLMVGNGGVAHFLLRYFNIEDRQISYPLLA